MDIGYALSSEEHAPADLVRYARSAEQRGFGFALISDHFHPWVSHQGQSGFVWATLGAIAQATERLRIGTGVTCPLIRIHPVLVAQAAATVATLMPGRFFLGVGSGENLNEHVTGCGWPPAHERIEMLAEAMHVIRLLWEGGTQSFRGDYYTVDEAQLFTLPDEPPALCVAASGPVSGELAGSAGDGLIAVAPDEELVQAFVEAGGDEKPRYGQVTVCWAASVEEARRTAHAWWPTSGLGGDLSWELKTPELFEAACENVTEDRVAEKIVCGPDAEAHLEAIREFERAGFDHVYVHQVGPDQDGFFEFYARSVLPKL